MPPNRKRWADYSSSENSASFQEHFRRKLATDASYQTGLRALDNSQASLNRRMQEIVGSGGTAPRVQKTVQKQRNSPRKAVRPKKEEIGFDSESEEEDRRLARAEPANSTTQTPPKEQKQGSPSKISGAAVEFVPQQATVPPAGRTPPAGPEHSWTALGSVSIGAVPARTPLEWEQGSVASTARSSRRTGKRTRTRANPGGIDVATDAGQRRRLVELEMLFERKEWHAFQKCATPLEKLELPPEPTEEQARNSKRSFELRVNSFFRHLLEVTDRHGGAATILSADELKATEARIEELKAEKKAITEAAL